MIFGYHTCVKLDTKSFCIPLKSHDFAMRLTVSRTISRSLDQLRKSHGKRIHKLIHKLFRNFWIFEIQQPSPLFFEGLGTTIHIWKTHVKYGHHEVITILVKMVDRDKGHSADLSTP